MRKIPNRVKMEYTGLLLLNVGAVKVFGWWAIPMIWGVLFIWASQ